MLKRKIIEKIESWKQTKTGQGLLITGARQVGKTSAVEQFARDNYRSFLKIDFVERPDAVELIGEARSLDDLIVRITALASSPIASDTKTLLFLMRCSVAETPSPGCVILRKTIVSMSFTPAPCSGLRRSIFGRCR